MNGDARYRIHFAKKGQRAEDALDVEWLPRHLRVVQAAYRTEVDEEESVARQVRDGVRVRQYPSGAVKFVEDLDPPEGRR